MTAAAAITFFPSAVGSYGLMAYLGVEPGDTLKLAEETQMCNRTALSD